MADLPIYSQGTGLYLEDPDGSSTLVRIARVRGDIPFPQINRDEQEVTDHDSPSGTKEFIATTSDPGSIDLTINYLPAEATHQKLIALAESGEMRSWEIRMVDPATSAWAFTAWVKSFRPKASVTDVYQADVTLRLSGAITPPA